MPGLLRLAYLSLLGLAAACSSRVDPLIVPRSTEVVSIDATISNSYDTETKTYRGAVHIDDPKKIDEVLKRVGELNRNMSIPSGTFPTPTHALVVNDRNNTNLVVFVGLDWIGGKNIVPGKAVENRAAHLSESDRSAFLKMVGIDDYRFR